MRELVTHYSMTMYNIEHFCCVVEARENKRMIICISAYTIVCDFIALWRHDCTLVKTNKYIAINICIGGVGVTDGSLGQTW